MKEILFILFLCVTNAFFVKAQQPTLWQSVPLDFNDFYLGNTSGPWVMYYDSVTDASYIAGTFQKIGDSSCNVVRLDSNGYTLLPPSPLPYTYDIIRYHGKIYFAGPGLATWDGQNWAVLDTTVGVGRFEVHQDSLWAAVELPGYVSSVAKWTGSSWQNMYHADTLTEGGWAIHDIAFYKGELYIGGNLNNIDHPDISEIARFNGTKWTDVGHFQDGDLSDVRRLMVWKDTLYVAGSFRESDGSPGNGIAKWDGDHWHRLSGGVLQSSIPAVTDMMVLNDNLYITGWFYWVDGMQPPIISMIDLAKWDGHQWCTMGTHPDNVIFTLGRFRDSLFIMGSFNHLNGDSMRRMAKWIGGDYTDSCAQPDTTTGIADQPALATKSLSVFPNPAAGILNVCFQCGQLAERAGEIVVTDVIGRVVLRKAIYLYAGDNHHRLAINDLSPGMYFLRIKGKDYSLATKFIKQKTSQ